MEGGNSRGNIVVPLHFPIAYKNVGSDSIKYSHVYKKHNHSGSVNLICCTIKGVNYLVDKGQVGKVKSG